MMSFLDTYSIRARLFPAILAIAPAIVLATIAVSWTTFSLPQAVTAAAVGVLFFGAADLGRRFGKAAQSKLFKATGGKPTLRILERANRVLDNRSKDRYRNFIASMLCEAPPTERDEIERPGEVAEFYDRCSNWLRERTRDRTKFKVLFEENVTYGYRRNLLGLKWPALVLNLAVVVFCLGVMRGEIGLSVDFRLLITVLVFAAIHALVFLLSVTKRSVLDASEQYARQLVLCCELLMRDEPDAPKLIVAQQAG